MNKPTHGYNDIDIVDLLEQCKQSDETGYVMKVAREEILRLRAEIAETKKAIAETHAAVVAQVERANKAIEHITRQLGL